jgi:holliday junction DNA helicase RuvA
MIGFLRGTVTTKLLKPQICLITLDVRDVGYELLVTASSSALLTTNSEQIQFFTHQVVREDQFLLFGFLQVAERDLFRQIVSVSGIGANMAMALLNTLNMQDLVKAIVTGNTRLLSLTPGVGQKTAARLALELKTKLSDWRSQQTSGTSISNITSELQADLETTLLALGYTSAEINQVLVAIAGQVAVKDLQDIEAWLKAAIVWLSKS